MEGRLDIVEHQHLHALLPLVNRRLVPKDSVCVAGGVACGGVGGGMRADLILKKIAFRCIVMRAPSSSCSSTSALRLGVAVLLVVVMVVGVVRSAGGEWLAHPMSPSRRYETSSALSVTRSPSPPPPALAARGGSVET